MSNQYELMTLFTDGGFMMYPLVLCSLVALGVIIAKVWTLFVAHRDSRKLLHDIEDLTQGGRLPDAIELAENTRGPVAAILLAGLRRVQERQAGGQGSAKDVQKAISTTGIIELDFLERGLAVLGTIANVAPMLGFLGTVIGMILAFQAIEIAGQVDPQLVASGIKVALITTATGLTIAIPVNIAYNYFVTRIDRLIQDMEEGAQKVLSLIWSIEDRGGYERAS
ncbi:MAG: MotA/TolQ/ExbB proton channel family protein [Gemmatimonadota bacterium]|nr:MotA/TolQ/ExbB proton channel family protein [Gemmatimonadota bacterium]